MYISKKNTRYKNMEKNYYNKKPQTSPQREVPLMRVTEDLYLFLQQLQNLLSGGCLRWGHPTNGGRESPAAVRGPVPQPAAPSALCR